MEFSNAFSHHHHPGDFRAQRAAEAVLKGIGWRVGNVKSRVGLFLFGMSFCLRPVSAKEGCNIPRDAPSERMFRKEFAVLHFFLLLPQIDSKLVTSLLEIFTKLVCSGICADLCETGKSKRETPFNGV